MEDSLQHEDLLIRLRGELNEGKIKLWEPPYYDPSCDDVTASVKDLAKKYASSLSMTYESVLNGLCELQLHSLERNKANTEYKDTGVATLRVKVTMPGKKPNVVRIQKKLDTLGGELIDDVAKDVDIAADRIKLIFNGKVIKAVSTLQEQSVTNGAQMMALVMAEKPEAEKIKEEDKMYMEMKATREDATLLTEYVDDFDEDEYMKLEDQSGNAVELPPAERKALLVGMALHERGRSAIRDKDYSLALILLLEADKQFNECRSSILSSVDNPALVQLDIAWCYLCLRALGAASDAGARLRAAERAFDRSYGADQQRLIALKGTDANERVVLMRLYLLQGIVAYHQNKRADARRLLDRAERELARLRVDENSVTALMELGWSREQARAGLRAAGGGRDAAHQYLHERQRERERAREQHREDRKRRQLGVCLDGAPVDELLVGFLQGTGTSRRRAVVALRNTNNNVTDALKLIQDQPHMLDDPDLSSDETDASSEDSQVEPDNKLVAELEAMGYLAAEARSALRVARNNIQHAIELLVTGAAHDVSLSPDEHVEDPSTSAGAGAHTHKRARKPKRKSKKQRQLAWERLSSAIRGEEDDHLHSSLQEEENFLTQYKSLL